MDGSAIVVGLASSPGPDWLKDIVRKVGLRLKVHNALRALHTEYQVQCSYSGYLHCYIMYVLIISSYRLQFHGKI